MEAEFSYQFFNTTVSAWDAMYRAISDAQKSIYWEVYALVDDLSGRPFIDLLCQKARAGLDVKVVVDAVGSYDLSDRAAQSLKNAGVRVQVFNRLMPSFNIKDWLSRAWHRTHRKVLVIDEETAFIGGVNVEALSKDWYDLHLKLTGKVVRPMLYGFARSYVHAGGNPKDVKDLLHPKLIAGINDLKKKINLILNSPIYPKDSPFKRFYSQALDVAKESFTLLSPYYVPDRQFLELVAKARKRGVKVNIILPWKTDLKIMEYMARAFYGVSEKAGAALYFLKRMNHGKAITSDNKIGIVGSSNLTPRSFFYNQEAGVSFSHEQMINDLNHILDDWKNEAVPMSELGWGKRNWYRRFKDWWLHRFSDYV